MACPICGVRCRCAGQVAQRTTRLCAGGEDVFDDGEQFVSSVKGSDSDSRDEQILASSTLASSMERDAAKTCAEGQARSPVGAGAGAQTAVASVSEEDWRNEVASRLQRYKAKRRSKYGEHSLALNFESTAANHVFLRPEGVPEEEVVQVEEEQKNVEGETEPLIVAAVAKSEAPATKSEPVISPRPDNSLSPTVAPAAAPAPARAPEGKLIAFPKPAMLPVPKPESYEPHDGLAEPVFETPRILEVTEVVPAAPPMPDLNLDAGPGFQGQEEDEFILPKPVASIAQRLFAAIVDFMVVLVATGLFGIIELKLGISPEGFDKRAALAMVGTVPSLFWLAYSYMFMVYGTGTLGVKVSGTTTVDFDGKVAGRKLRLQRWIALQLACFSLGLGVLWCAIDEDQLCWHDRITRSYPTSAD